MLSQHDKDEKNKRKSSLLRRGFKMGYIDLDANDNHQTIKGNRKFLIKLSFSTVHDQLRIGRHS